MASQNQWQNRGTACVTIACALGMLTLGECRLFNRLLFQEHEEYEFVLSGVSGVLLGRPVSPSWQHRFLTPWAISAFDSLTHDRLGSLKLFMWLMVAAANVLSFALLRKRGHSVTASVLGAACFGFAHLLLAYRLEYPWDGVDILLFLSFGYWASERRPLFPFIPALAVCTLNHETALFVPLWYLLAPLEQPGTFRQQARAWCGALSIAAAMATAIWLLRRHFYVGQPSMPGQVFEQPLPVIDNHFHVFHNVRQFLIEDLRSARVFISFGLLIALLSLARSIERGIHVRAAVWSLFVIASIFVFGYVNETRHYLMLLAFWFGYAWRLEVSRESRLVH